MLTPCLLWIFWWNQRADAVLHPRQGWSFSPAQTIIAAAWPFQLVHPSVQLPLLSFCLWTCSVLQFKYRYYCINYFN